MKITQNFLNDINICSEGMQEGIDNYMGQDFDVVVHDLISRGMKLEAGWLASFKDTEIYVKNGGNIITMGAYQVFNPLTGQHVRYGTEVEAKAALIDVAAQVLKHHCPAVIQEMSNENGDTTWVTTTMHETLVVS